MQITLGVKNKTSNIACRGELGSLPLIFNVILNMVKYWCHLIKGKNIVNTLLHEAYKLSLSMYNSNQESFIGCIREIFKGLNLDYCFINQNQLTETFIINKVKYALKKKMHTLWLDKINSNFGRGNSKSGNKLRTYKKFKNIFSFENYLNIKSKTNRQIISKFRTSSHDLEIEKG